MAQLQCKTRGGASPQGKTRVYFACHPDDHDRYFDVVTDEILGHVSCAIFYYPSGEVVMDEDYYLNLSQMRMIIMPVTAQLLDSPSRAMDVELAYAKEHHIPVLPLMQERGLEKKYSKKFGDLQFLDKNDQNPTAIPYQEKLKRYLKTMIVGHAFGIEDAFTARIFLSYRKADRKNAQQLIRMIHQDRRCRDIAIWYDEFLKPGEDFNDAIRSELQQSDLFLMLATRNLLQKNNYILENEYPYAKELGLPMLIVPMAPVEQDALACALEPEGHPIPDCADPYDGETLIQMILAKVNDRRKIRIGDASEQIFRLGCAYIEGYRAERNCPLALELFHEAAKEGKPEAVLRLALMYENGDCVDQNWQEATLWRGRYTEYTRRCLEKTHNAYWAYEYHINLMELAWDWEKVENWPAAEDVHRIKLHMEEKIFPEYGIETSISGLAGSYIDLGRVTQKQGKLGETRKWYTLAARLLQEIPWDETRCLRKLFAISLAMLGSDLEEAGCTADARECYAYALDLLKDFPERDMDAIRMLVYGGLGRIDSDGRMLQRSIALAFPLIGRRIANLFRCLFKQKK